GPEPASAPPAAAAASGSIRVHVAGAVRHGGVYTLPSGARVQDAVDAAGGAASGADLETINLADFIKDGERVYIPYRSRRPAPREQVAGARAAIAHEGGRYPDAAPTPPPAPPASATASAKRGAAVPAGKININ